MAKDTQREVLPSTARISSNGNKSEYKDEKWLIEFENLKNLQFEEVANSLPFLKCFDI